MRTCTDICIQFQGITAPSELALIWQLPFPAGVSGTCVDGARMSSFYKVKTVMGALVPESPHRASQVGWHAIWDGLCWDPASQRAVTDLGYRGCVAGVTDFTGDINVTVSEKNGVEVGTVLGLWPVKAGNCMSV